MDHFVAKEMAVKVIFITFAGCLNEYVSIKKKNTYSKINSYFTFRRFISKFIAAIAIEGKKWWSTKWIRHWFVNVNGFEFENQILIFKWKRF